MKNFVTILVACLLVFVTAVQDKLPAFRKIEKADLEMKACDFDPDSEALYLLDIDEVQML